ncbi:MAG: DNA repair protein RadC [Victivallales bacterium]|nr:DNA repair protein RadC [Victivallales bacterium]
MNELMIMDMPAQERPRERLMRLGAMALSDRELLAILLRTGKQGDSALTLADQVLAHFQGELRRLAFAVPEEFQQVSGIGEAKAITLVAACELARRLASATLGEHPLLNSPGAVAQYMRTRIQRAAQEEFHVIMLDTRNQVIQEERITLGLLDRSLVHAREVFRRAIQCACQRIVLCHNHPSGDPHPSPEDLALSRVLSAAGNLLGIRVQDHIILGTQEADPLHIGYYSLGAHGQLNNEKS